MSPRSVRSVFTGALLGALVFTRSFAQPADAAEAAGSDVLQLDPFVVTDAKSLTTTLPVRPVAGVYGFDTPYQDIPRSITQINPQQFAQDVITNYSDFTRYSPSVNQSTGQLNNYGSPTIRGATSDVYQNGVRMLMRQQNNRPFTLNAYEAADIVAGPAPVIYGPTARTAGYVNYLTKKPAFDDQHTTVSLRLGKFYGGDLGTIANENWTIDTTGPIIKNKLAYRVSYQGENVDPYYRNISDSFHDIYATLAWLPASGLTVDWNVEWGKFDWVTNNSVNRITPDFVNNGTYLAGPATPIIQVGSAFYSPVLNASGGVTGWITRTRAGTGFTPGVATTDPTRNTTAGAGTIVGYVLDPANVHPESLDRTAALNAPGYPSTTDAFNTQLRVRKTFSDRFTVLSNTIYQYYQTDNPSNGGFYNWITDDTFETRVEGLLKLDYKIFGLPVHHDSNTGFSYRFEEVKNYKDGQAAGYGPTGDWFDLGADQNSWTRNAFFGATIYPFTGAITDPVLTRFGYLKGFWPYLTVPESPANADSPGGSGTGLSTTTNHTWTDSLSFYTQHSFKFGEKWLFDAGLRETYVFSKIRNPLALNPTNGAIHDSIDNWLPGYSFSLSYKPVPRLTTYATYAYVVATNGMTTGSPTWAAGNQYDPANFDSLSELSEFGAKAELIPGRLVGGLAVYRQTRDLTLTTVPGQDPVLSKGQFQGVEFNLRYQPTREFTVGLNYNYLDANSLDQTVSGPNPIVVDNTTNIIGSTSLGYGDWRVTNLPRNNVTLFASYQFASGFGVRADAWLRDSYIANNNASVVIPSEYNLNVGVFYNRAAWSVQVDFQNVTDERNFAGASTVLEPFGVQGRITYKF